MTRVGASLFLVRHAQPLVEAGVCYGQLDMKADAGATWTCAQALAKVLPLGIRVVTSPLQRCEQLAQSLIDLQPSLTVERDPLLQEMNFGDWEGQPWNAIARAELQAWTTDFAAYRPGGSGESVNTFLARVACAFDALPRHADTLWVTHAGVIRAVHLIASGQRMLQRADEWPITAPAYGQWCKLALKPSR